MKYCTQIQTAVQVAKAGMCHYGESDTCWIITFTAIYDPLHQEMLKLEYRNTG
jgi:hypothetical protein